MKQRPHLAIARAIAIPLIALAALAGCKYEGAYEDGLGMRDPVATNAALVFVDDAQNELLFFLPGESDFTLRRQAIISEGERVLWTTPTVDKSELLVLGGPADAKQEDVEETLYRVSADGSGTPTEYSVLAPFNAVALSPDGRHAVLYFSGADTDAPLNNANEVSIVDLESSEVRNLTLNGFGGRVQAVEFPAQVEVGVPTPVVVGTVERDIVTFLADGETVTIDMANADANQVANRLSENDEFVPEGTLLRPGSEGIDPALFVRSAASPDIMMLFLQDKIEAGGEEEGFTTKPNPIPVGAGTTDFLYHDEAGLAYLVSANANTNNFVFTDITTQGSFEVSAEGELRHLFLRDKQRGDLTVQQLVGWAPGSTELHTLDLDGIGSSIGRRPSHLKVETGIDELVVLDNDRVLIGSGLTLYVVDFTKDQVTPLEAKSPYDPRSSALEGDQLLLGTPGQAWVSTVNLVDLNPESMLLDETITDFFYLESANKVVSTHSDALGYLTVADASDPSRKTSYSAWGFFVEGILD